MAKSMNFNIFEDMADSLFSQLAILSLLGFAETGGRGQREKHDFFTGAGADIVMQTDHADTGGRLNHRFHERPCQLNQLGADFLEQIPPLLGLKRLDEMLFGRRQDTVESNDQQVSDQVCLDVLGSAAHVFLLEIRDSPADRGFHFSLRFHHGFSSRRLQIS